MLGFVPQPQPMIGHQQPIMRIAGLSAMAVVVVCGLWYVCRLQPESLQVPVANFTSP